MARLVNGGHDFSGKTVAPGNDIDPGGYAWTPIGTFDTGFAGKFEGENHRITGLKITSSDLCVGLFGCTNAAATIGKLGVGAAVISSAQAFVGGFVGYLDFNATAANSYAAGNVTGNGGDNVGGFVGTAFGTVTNGCFNKSASQILNEVQRASTQLLFCGMDSTPSTGDNTSAAATSAFAATLNTNKGAHAGWASWAYAAGKNGGLPYLDGVGDAPELAAAVSAGERVYTSKVTASVPNGTLLCAVLSAPISTPNAGDYYSDDVSGTFSINPGESFSGASAGKYLALYEIDSNWNITAFRLLQVTSGDINHTINDTDTGMQFDVSDATMNTSDQIYSRDAVLPSTDPIFSTISGLIKSDSSLGELQNLVACDLGIMTADTGENVSFTGTVKVRIPIPSGMNGNIRAFWYDGSTGRLTDMGAVQENGCLVFNTTHFSYYAVAQLGAPKSSATGSNPSVPNPNNTNTNTNPSAPNPNTGGKNLPAIPFAIVCSGFAAGLAVLGKRAHTSKR